MKIYTLLLGSLIVGLPLRGQALTIESGPERTDLLELYTSEGCSSCPPAEARFSQLKTDAGLWKKFVPVAFHVDYWNSLGWPDRFSSPDFTARQNDYARSWGGDSVYTPEFVLNGRERRAGSEPGREGERPGVLRIVVEDRTHLIVTFQPSVAPVEPLAVTVAPLGSGLVTDVPRGENAGRKLEHDFVAMGLLTVPLEAHGAVFEARVDLPVNTVARISAVAAWIHSASHPTSLQAAGGMIP